MCNILIIAISAVAEQTREAAMSWTSEVTGGFIVALAQEEVNEQLQSRYYAKLASCKCPKFHLWTCASDCSV